MPDDSARALDLKLEQLAGEVPALKRSQGPVCSESSAGLASADASPPQQPQPVPKQRPLPEQKLVVKDHPTPSQALSLAEPGLERQQCTFEASMAYAQASVLAADFQTTSRQKLANPKAPIPGPPVLTADPQTTSNQKLDNPKALSPGPAVLTADPQTTSNQKLSNPARAATEQTAKCPQRHGVDKHVPSEAEISEVHMQGSETSEEPQDFEVPENIQIDSDVGPDEFPDKASPELLNRIF